MYMWMHCMQMHDVQMWMCCVQWWMHCVQCKWKKKEKMRLVVICAHRDNTHLVCALSVNAWTCGIGDRWDAKEREGGGECQKRAWQELGLRKFCVCLHSHNVLLITHITLFVYINTESLSLSLTRSLSFTTTTACWPIPTHVNTSPPLHMSTNTHHKYFLLFLLLFLLYIRSANSRHNHCCMHRWQPPSPPFICLCLPPHPHKFLFYLSFFTSVYICSVDDHHHHPSTSMATNTTMSTCTRHAAGKHYFTMYSMVLTLFSLSLFVLHLHNNTSPTHQPLSLAINRQKLQVFFLLSFLLFNTLAESMATTHIHISAMLTASTDKSPFVFFFFFTPTVLMVTTPPF